MKDRIFANVGCGSTPTAGWINFDNSLTVRISGSLAWLLASVGAMSSSQVRFLEVARRHGIRYATATRLPLPDQALHGLYTSHMLEHLSRLEASRFLREAHRVLRSGGTLRVSVPDLSKLVEDYRADGNADVFQQRMMMATDVSSLSRRFQLALLGPRHHQWMYDERSLGALLTAAGFVEVSRPAPGRTRMDDVPTLDLREREDESLVMEGTRP